MMKKVIFSPNVPSPSGSYSQAIKVGNFVFISGCAGEDPKSNSLVKPGDIVAQTKQALFNLKAILQESCLSLENIVKINAYINDINSFKDFDKTYSLFFKETPPARTTIEVGHFPEGMTVEIDCIAYIDNKEK
jgi:2-iminobutanoate/2-iminopropanoate deaminase